MKRIGKTVWFMAVVAVSVLILAACSDGGEHDASDVRSNLQASDATHLFDGVYSGEWSIDQQVVDTAQLVVVGNVLKVRLPESILTELIGLQSQRTILLFPQVRLLLYAR